MDHFSAIILGAAMAETIHWSYVLMDRRARLARQTIKRAAQPIRIEVTVNLVAVSRAQDAQ